MGNRWRAKPYKRCQGISWGISEATPGLIALCVVIVSAHLGHVVVIFCLHIYTVCQAMYFLSGDSELSEIGDRTKALYKLIYEAIKNRLTIEAGTAPVKRIVQEFSRHLFEGTAVQLRNATTAASSNATTGPSAPIKSRARTFKDFQFVLPASVEPHDIAARSDSGEEFDFTAANAEPDSAGEEKDISTTSATLAPTSRSVFDIYVTISPLIQSRSDSTVKSAISSIAGSFADLTVHEPTMLHIDTPPAVAAPAQHAINAPATEVPPVFHNKSQVADKPKRGSKQARAKNTTAVGKGVRAQANRALPANGTGSTTSAPVAQPTVRRSTRNKADSN